MLTTYEVTQHFSLTDQFPREFTIPLPKRLLKQDAFRLYTHPEPQENTKKKGEDFGYNDEGDDLKIIV